jgi:hypothetical protein
MDFSVEVEATDYTDGATSFLSHLYTSLLSFTIVDIDWEGYLVIESSNSSGSFSNDENGDTGNPVEIDLKGSGNLVNATYSNAAAGDTITAYIKGEEQACSDTLVLEAEEVVDEDVPEEEVVVVEEVIEEEPEEEEEEEEVVVVVEDEEGDYDFDAITAAREDLCTQPFDDVSEGDWAYYYIWRMFCTNVVQGRTYNTYFVPTGDTTRAEALKVLMLLSGHTTDDASGKSESYKDVDSNDWFYPYYVLAYEENIVRGEYAHPDDPITRGDYVVYMMRIANQTLWGWDESDIPFSDLSKSDYYTYAIIIGYNKIVVDPDSGDEVRVFGGYSNGTSGAKNTIARNEAMALALRFYLAYYAD